MLPLKGPCYPGDGCPFFSWCFFGMKVFFFFFFPDALGSSFIPCIGPNPVEPLSGPVQEEGETAITPSWPWAWWVSKADPRPDPTNGLQLLGLLGHPAAKIWYEKKYSRMVKDVNLGVRPQESNPPLRLNYLCDPNLLDS